MAPVVRSAWRRVIVCFVLVHCVAPLFHSILTAIAMSVQSQVTPEVLLFVNETVLLSGWPYSAGDEPHLKLIEPSMPTCTIDTVCSYFISLDRPPPGNLQAEVDVHFEHDPESTSSADFYFVVEDPLLPTSRKHLQPGNNL